MSPLRASDDNPLPTEGVETLLLIWLVFWLSVILPRYLPNPVDQWFQRVRQHHSSGGCGGFSPPSQSCLEDKHTT